ncbi:AT-rich interactive domain-containing protein 3C-like isoform X3 [Hylaeus anthracinus]|uniref:AT-rich interactive domain-containing protein 3C-like isoform X3 n=1 Tax=Hylaeus volcanicus TaxID=313075 RepID=UPI0023B84F0F|nr:AT-rich interactive domain-containing protein 3C-like isoform X3 [Hylaeus volcanicus]XP_053999405.1 AT-rich interactive domain-containing protein 3C-like isoform X3 [Hylaeus anthracinus]
MEMSDEYQDMGNPGGGVAMANMPIAHHRHTPDSPMSHQEEDLSDPDLQDEESGEELPQQPLQGNTHSSSDNASVPAGTPTPLTHLNSLMSTHHPHFLAKLKMELYEINDDPKRKEFLDDLFSYMQKRGTPINRLPIMAKSVLDLYELYNLVIARGGLVDVINKKLWQEIIKGLHLPSSITSAAFTLRTQYMKYLYPYECEKRRLSTPAELQAAIDGNRREGRRSSYGAYAGGGSGGPDSLVQRNPHTPSSLALHAQMSPLSLVTAVAAGGQHHGPQSLVNGSAAHTPLPHHPHHPQHPQGPLGQPPNAGPIPGMAPSEFEARMVEYVKLLNKELRSAGAGTPPPIIHRQGSASPPSSTPPRDAGAFSALEMSRLTLWNMYNNNTLYPGVGHQPPLSPQASHSPVPPASSPEPQREALDLGLRSSPVSSPPARQSSPSSGGSMQVKRDPELISTPGPPPAKRLLSDDDSPIEKNTPTSIGTHIKISNRGDGRNGDNSLVVSMELNGVMYQGVLFAQSDSRIATSTATNNNNSTKSSRSIVS